MPTNSQEIGQAWDKADSLLADAKAQQQQVDAMLAEANNKKTAGEEYLTRGQLAEGTGRSEPLVRRRIQAAQRNGK